MLRIVKLKQRCKTPTPATTPTQDKYTIVKTVPQSSPNIDSWVISYHFPTTTKIQGEFGLEDEIGTIQITHIRWQKLPLPKNTKLHTPNKLKIWFHKLIDKKYQFNSRSFNFIDSTNTYYNTITKDEWNTHNIPRSFIQDVYFIPLFTNTETDVDCVDTLTYLPTPLKIDIRKEYIKQLSK